MEITAIGSAWFGVERVGGGVKIQGKYKDLMQVRDDLTKTKRVFFFSIILCKME